MKHSTKRLGWDVLLCLAAALFYGLNRLWLQKQFSGWFFTCYANDVCAGLVLTAWLDLVLTLGHRRPVRSWKQTVPFLLLCGVVWEVLAPLWKAGAVLDPWDFFAYQAGGLLYLLLLRFQRTSS